jgi:hypothetical protein
MGTNVPGSLLGVARRRLRLQAIHPLDVGDAVGRALWAMRAGRSTSLPSRSRTPTGSARTLGARQVPLSRAVVRAREL